MEELQKKVEFIIHPDFESLNWSRGWGNGKNREN